jgi:hypothetical protein
LLSFATSLLASLETPLVALWTFSVTKLPACLMESMMVDVVVVLIWFVWKVFVVVMVGWFESMMVMKREEEV